jgi:small-conductance mechanosensitive channel
VLLLGLALSKLCQRGLAQLANRFSQKRLVIKQWTTFIVFAVYGVTLLLAAVILFDFSSQTIFALSGGAAVTVGFALKDVAAGLLSSLSILATKPFQVGDRVSFQGHYGEITEIGLRTVRMVTLDDNLVTIPSNAFLTEAVASANAGQLDCMVIIPVFLDAKADLPRAKELMQDAVLASRYLYLGKPFTVLTSAEISSDGTAYIKLIAKAYVYDARYEKAFLSDVTEQLISCFHAEGIEMPRPSRAAA